MEDKIEVGEYVRTKKGQIDKFEKLLGYEDDKETSIVKCKEKRFWLEDIKKHKQYLIDLIEKGDYVNGYLVIEISKGRKYFTIVGKYGLTQYEFQKVRDKVYNIKSIVTKEQFSSIEYKV